MTERRYPVDAIRGDRCRYVRNIHLTPSVDIEGIMRHMVRVILLLVVIVLLPAEARAQSLSTTLANRSMAGVSDRPEELEIEEITVAGVEAESMQRFVIQSSGLEVGQTLTLPGDPAIADAIRSVYDLRVFSDVNISEVARTEEGVRLVIAVVEEPQLADYTFSGIKKKHRRDLEKEIPLYKGSRMRPADVERSVQIIEEYFAGKGYMLAEVDVLRQSGPGNTVTLDFSVSQGNRVRISEVRITGNEEVAAGKLRGRMKKTRPKSRVKFWRKSRYDESLYTQDKANLVGYYNSQGYYDARLVRDTVYLDNSAVKPGIVVELDVVEGPQYHVRNIDWDGNTVYSDDVLSAALGLQKGDVYDSEQLEQNLHGNKRSSDVSSLYMNRGYMLFRVQPEVRIVEGDSLDLYYDLYEGEIFEFGEITIAGNTKTKEHVIRRELYTIPGQTFSREYIQETIRRLSQLSYFDQEKLGAGPSIALDQENRTVDLTYSLEEIGSDQLELSGTYGRFGLILMLRFGFNNFSFQDINKRRAWRPLPSGDGQRLSVGLQSNGRAYQSYTLSFTEPWFRGRPTPVGFSLSHSRFSGGSFYTLTSNRFDTGQLFVRSSATVFYEKRLTWPDDQFSTSTSLGYQYFLNREFTSVLPEGTSEQVTVRQSLTRSSLDHPVFPTTGSSLVLSGEVALPVPGFVQYHKWRFNTEWNVPLAPKVAVSFASEFGFIGSLTGEEVLFERYVVGGSPFDFQGFTDNFGKEIVYMRAYPARALGPRRGNEAIGGRILNKFSSELRALVIQTPQLTAAPYVFMDAANTWDSFETYSPTQLFRSAGVGVRLLLPILGMMEMSYGYNFDEFIPIAGQDSRHSGANKWLFQFTIGQGF